MKSTLPRFLAATVVLALCCHAAAAAANYCVRAGADGSANGLDWANAFPQLPANLVRGATYYVAAGTYPPLNLYDAEQGATYIRIRKATAAEHGTDTGWQAPYGDGEAHFRGNSWVKAGYYDLDGATGTGTSGYGFRFSAEKGNIISLRAGGGNSSVTLAGLRFRHLEVHQTGTAERSHGFATAQAQHRDYVWQHCYIHDLMGGVMFMLGNLQGGLIEHCYSARNHHLTPWHMEALTSASTRDIEVRYSTWEDIQGTGVLQVGHPNGERWKIHGNVFRWTRDFGTTINNGVVGSVTAGSVRDIRIYNNTFVGIKAIIFNTGDIKDAHAFNNVYYQCWNVAFGGGVTRDYNYFLECALGSTPLQAHDVADTGDPFVDWKNRNYRLTRATPPGQAFAAPFDLDPNGNTRGADAVWDRGAYEFRDPPPPQPVPLTITVEPDADWVYQNAPVTTGDRHTIILTVSVTDDPDGNANYSVSVAPTPTSAGKVFVEPTADPMVWRLRAGRRDTDPAGPVTLHVVVGGLQSGSQGEATLQLAVRLLGDIDGDDSVNANDSVQLTKRLNNLNVAPLQPRDFDLTGDGSVTTDDDVLLTRILNNLSVP